MLGVFFLGGGMPSWAMVEDGSPSSVHMTIFLRAGGKPPFFKTEDRERVTRLTITLGDPKEAKSRGASSLRLFINTVLEEAQSLSQLTF